MNRHLSSLCTVLLFLQSGCASTSASTATTESDVADETAVELTHDDYPVDREVVRLAGGDSMGFSGEVEEIENPCVIKVENLRPSAVYVRTADGQPVTYVPAMRTRQVHGDPQIHTTVDLGAARDADGSFFARERVECAARATLLWTVE